MMQPVFNLRLEARPGSTFEDLCVESQRLADLLRVTVTFDANGVRCIARPDGAAARLLSNLNLMIGQIQPEGVKAYAVS